MHGPIGSFLASELIAHSLVANLVRRITYQRHLLAYGDDEFGEADMLECMLLDNSLYDTSWGA